MGPPLKWNENTYIHTFISVKGNGENIIIILKNFRMFQCFILTRNNGLRHVSTIGKIIKQQCVLHMSLQYGELQPINGWDLLASLGHPSKFQRVSRLAFVTAGTSLTGGQPNFALCFAVSWVATPCIHFRGRLPLTEFCPVQNSLYVQVLRSRILAALLHGTPAAVVSQTLRRGTRNWITELSQRAPPKFGRAAITLGIGPHSSCNYY